MPVKQRETKADQLDLQGYHPRNGNLQLFTSLSDTLPGLNLALAAVESETNGLVDDLHPCRSSLSESPGNLSISMRAVFPEQEYSPLPAT
jgi:hypothetical protein